MPNKFFIIFFTVALPLFPQVGIDASKLPAPVTAPDQHISLDVIVRDKAGKPVGGLEQNDFTLTDDKQPVKLTSFQAVKPDEPLEVVLLIDNVNSAFSLTAQMKEQVKKFLSRNEGRLDQPVSLIVFADAGASVLAPTRDGNQIIAAMDKMSFGLRTVTRTQGVYGAIDRFQMSVRTLLLLAESEGKKPGRKMVIWVGPGWPILSGPNIRLTTKEQNELFKSIATTSTALRQARIVLYSVDPIGVVDAGTIRTTWYENFLKGVKAAKNVDAGDLALQVLAVQSGGRVINSGNDIVSEIAACTADANAWYVLSFDSPKADGPNEYHALSVKMDKPGLTARTRTGYYAQP